MGVSDQDGTAGVPPIRFAQARGARLAYQDFGDGPATVVAVPPLAQNIETAWEWPAIRAMFDRLGSFSRWVHFDKRGTGASDRRSRVPGIDERVDDFRAVMDAAGIDRAFLYGASEGGPMALLFAVTYPERVEGIILHGSGARSCETELSDDEWAELPGLIRQSAARWGTPESPYSGGLAPSLVGDPEFLAWHERYERMAADQESLAELMTISFTVDVRSVLADIKVPTLILHAARDQLVPVRFSREAAAGIPHAELVEYDSADHAAYAGNQVWLDANDDGTYQAGSEDGIAGVTLDLNRYVLTLLQHRAAIARQVHLCEDLRDVDDLEHRFGLGRRFAGILQAPDDNAGQWRADRGLIEGDFGGLQLQRRDFELELPI